MRIYTAAVQLALLAHIALATALQIVGHSFGVAGRNETFDYVIVGGGNAGNVMALRLAQAGHSVALVEGGSFYELTGNMSVVPQYNLGYFAEPTSPPKVVDWNIDTLPQAALNGRSIRYSQGKAFGGATALNSMAYHRQTVGSAQLWADQVGDQSYTWDNVLPYYKKSVTFTPPNLQKIGGGFESDYFNYDTRAFGKGGPLNVTYANYQHPAGISLSEGLREIGISRIDGLSSGKLIGYSPLTVTIDNRDATRSSSETSFLQLALATTPLRVYQQTIARRVVFNSAKRATGVIVETNRASGNLYVLSAAKEVIVSAGAFRSPQLLMVSGVGPSSTLNRLGIDVVSDLPGVGQGLSDQPVVGLSYQVDATTDFKLIVDQAYAAQALQQYRDTQNGPLSSIGGDLLGFEKVSSTLREALQPATREFIDTFPKDWPDFELVPIAIGAPSAEPGPTDNFLSLNLALLTYKSLGNVTIDSTDTNYNPVVSPNLLEDPTDMDLMVQGFKRIREFAKASPGVLAETVPGPSVETDEQIIEYIRSATTRIYHSSAGCKMGKESDKMAVTDTQGKVRGVSGLRVVDSSILPFLPPGHPMSTVYMLAEKISSEMLGQKTIGGHDEL